MKKRTDLNGGWMNAAADAARDGEVELRAREALLDGARRRRERRAVRQKALACGGAVAVLALVAMLWPKTERVTPTQVASMAEPVTRVVEKREPLVPEISQAELAEWFPDSRVAVVRREGSAELVWVPKRGS